MQEDRLQVLAATAALRKELLHEAGQWSCQGSFQDLVANHIKKPAHTDLHIVGICAKNSQRFEAR
jgi:hypothetical protein